MCERALRILEREGNDESTHCSRRRAQDDGLAAQDERPQRRRARAPHARARAAREGVRLRAPQVRDGLQGRSRDALLHRRQGETAQRARESREGAAVFLHTRGKDHDATVKISCVLGWICSNERQFDAADGHFARVLAYAEKDRESDAPLWKRAHGGRLVNRARRLVDDAGGAQNDAAADAAMEAFALLDEINGPMAELDAACELRNDRPMPLGRSRRRLRVRRESADATPPSSEPRIPSPCHVDFHARPRRSDRRPLTHAGEVCLAIARAVGIRRRSSSLLVLLVAQCESDGRGIDSTAAVWASRLWRRIPTPPWPCFVAACARCSRLVVLSVGARALARAAGTARAFRHLARGCARCAPETHAADAIAGDAGAAGVAGVAMLSSAGRADSLARGHRRRAPPLQTTARRSRGSWGCT